MNKVDEAARRQEEKAVFEARVWGIVQGVGFRYYAQAEAERLGITGWARNLPDGSVELWIEGGEKAAKLFLKWLASGPPHARVDRVESERQKCAKNYKTFGVK